MKAAIDEALLVLRAQCDDREAVESLLRRIQPALLRYLRGLLGAEDAEDLLQDVLVLIYRRIRQLDNPELFRPWAFRIASRAAFRHLRKKKRLPLRASEEALDDLPAAEPVTAFEFEHVSDALAGLSPASRAVLALHFQEEMTLSEVAAVLEIPPGTVRSRLAYGLAILRKQLATERSEHDTTARRD